MASDKMNAQKGEGLGWIVFNNPERHNAVSLDMWLAAIEIIDDFVRDEAVRVIIVRGSGERSFISGADISRFDDERAEAAAVTRYNKASETAFSNLMNARRGDFRYVAGQPFQERFQDRPSRRLRRPDARPQAGVAMGPERAHVPHEKGGVQATLGFLASQPQATDTSSNKGAADAR